MIEQFESFIQLDLPAPVIDTAPLPWHRYNPRKDIARWGSSLTSIDGGTSGVPDLDSLYEYNRLNGTAYREKDFTVKTDTYKKYFHELDGRFNLGRSHLIRLGTGGFFPPHRDLDEKTFRLIYTIKGCTQNNFVLMLNNEVLPMQDHRWYFLNTKMPHSVFSFFGSEFAVFNVIADELAKTSLLAALHIK
jgi:hypothetical protein